MMNTNDDKNDEETQQRERAATHGREGAAGKAPVTRGLPIDDIVLDKRLQVRNQISPGTVRQYVETLRAQKQLPPITVARINGAYVLIDGWHRIEATQRLGLNAIEASIIEGIDFDRARWLAATANLMHGLPLRGEEIRAVFCTYVKTGQHRKGRRGAVKSSREISSDLHGRVSYKTVLEWMRKDFPSVHQIMIHGENTESVKPNRKRKDAGEEMAAAVRNAITQAAAGFRGVTDPATRGELIAAMRSAVGDMEAAGEWTPPPPEVDDDDEPF